MEADRHQDINEINSIISETSDLIYDHSFVSMGVGDYNFQTGLIDYFEPTAPVNQLLNPMEKFVTNQKLISVCY